MKKNWFVRNLNLITSFYFGGIVAYAGFHLDDLMFWLICIPVITGYGFYHILNKD